MTSYLESHISAIGNEIDSMIDSIKLNMSKELDQFSSLTISKLNKAELPRFVSLHFIFCLILFSINFIFFFTFDFGKFRLPDDFRAENSISTVLKKLENYECFFVITQEFSLEKFCLCVVSYYFVIIV